jgi:uncharacterized protein YbjT (DUF2867 family)
MTTETQAKPVLVAGATGYIGSRLIPILLENGYSVRALARNPSKIISRPWGKHINLEIVSADLLDLNTLTRACQGGGAIYYLVHSMDPGSKDFATADRDAAENMIIAAEKSGLERIIYLGGLGEESNELSEHLRSRSEVARILSRGEVPVTVFRAAMIIGAGSASFEILRYLVDRLPVMITPRWVDTPSQPIGVRNVLHYLTACLENEATIGETFDIGQEEVISYQQLMRIYAEEAGLRKRFIVPVPVLTPRLSSYWIHLVTPVPAVLARPLAEGLRNEVICIDTRIRELLPQELFDCRKAIHLALERGNEQLEADSPDTVINNPPAEWSTAFDPTWAGGTRLSNSRQILLGASADKVWTVLVNIGNETDWCFGNWLWKLRSFFGRIFARIELENDPVSGTDPQPDDLLDVWKVCQAEEPQLLQMEMVKEMKIPGRGVLSFKLTESSANETILQLRADFTPRGIIGIIYWSVVGPILGRVFNSVLIKIGKGLRKTIIKGPVRAL